MRKACAAIGLSRVVYLYQSAARDNTPLVMRIKEIAQTRVYYGYRQLHVMLKREGSHSQPQAGLGHSRSAAWELRYCRVRLLPPRAKQKRYPALTLTGLQAAERDAASNVEPIDWKLIKDLPVTLPAQAIEKLEW